MLISAGQSFVDLIVHQMGQNGQAAGAKKLQIAQVALGERFARLVGLRAEPPARDTGMLSGWSG